MTQTGCLNCKHYDPHPRNQSTPRCLYNGCKFEPKVPNKEIK